MKFAELFAGIGGFRYGLEKANQGHSGNRQADICLSGRRQAFNGSRNDNSQTERPDRFSVGISYSKGYQCVWPNELDKYACAIYRYHYSEICEADIKTVDASTIPDFDLLTFGWPCQDNSIAGQRAGQGAGTRSGLLIEAIRVLRIKKPKYFIAENVPGLFSVNAGLDFYETIKMFTETGYDVQWQVLNTRWFLPQNRERIYFVGHLRGIPRPQIFPIGETNGLYSKTVGEVVTAIDANYGKGWLDHGQRTMVIQKRGGYGCSVYENETGTLKPTAPPVWYRLPMIVHENKSGTQTAHSEAQALRSGASHNYQTVNRIRRLTPIECERLQGFPDNFSKYGLTKDGKIIEISDTQRYKVLGNAVSIPIPELIGKYLMKAVQGAETMIKGINL